MSPGSEGSGSSRLVTGSPVLAGTAVATLPSGELALGESMSDADAPSAAVESDSATVTVGSSTLTLRWASTSHAGLVRDVNEDAVLARPGLFVVCDGMGGHRGGQRASGLAIADLGALPPADRAPGVRDVVAAFRTANDHVLVEGADNPELRGMGTTAAVVALVDNGGRSAFVVANVGDSRIYTLDDDTLSQVSTDHSVIQELLDAGQITMNEVAGHRDRHVVTRVLGSDPPPDVDVWLLEPAAGQRFLVCSDGVHGEIGDAQVGAALRIADTVEAVGALADAALASGGRDNFSAVVVDVVDRTDDQAALSDDTMPRELLASMVSDRPASHVQEPSGGSAPTAPISEVPRA